jgi:hypothetical protein
MSAAAQQRDVTASSDCVVLFILILAWVFFQLHKYASSVHNLV